MNYLNFKIKVCALIITCFILGCNDNANNNPFNKAKKAPPFGWKQKVNNKLIARIVLVQSDKNCAYTSGRNVECYSDTIHDKCSAIVTYLDGTPKEKWEDGCFSQPLIYDDGEFSFFYGKKTNP